MYCIIELSMIYKFKLLFIYFKVTLINLVVVNGNMVSYFYIILYEND